MSPSSSSNADSSAGPTFKVATRALSADLALARSDESARELGSMDTASLVVLLEKLAALDPAAIGEADPQLVVSGRRGRFTLRPGRGRLLLRPTVDRGETYVELAVADIPGFLDGREVQSPAPADAPGPGALPPPAAPRLAIALTLFALTALIVTTSAWLTFRPDELDPESDYVTLTAPAESTALRQQAIGRFVIGSGDDERTIEISPDGTARYREYGAGHELADERGGPYTIARRRAGQGPVLRVRDLGTIDLKNPDTIVYARETYQRRPGAEPATR